jgi:Cys-rich repeat protein
LSATTSRVRGITWLVLVSIAAACGLDFDKFDSTVSTLSKDAATANTPDGPATGSDDSATGATDGMTGNMADAVSDSTSGGALDDAPDTSSQAPLDGAAEATSDAAIVDGPSDQFAGEACTSSTPCPLKTPICSTNRLCAQCQVNGDCSGTTPYCSVPDGGAGTCVQCLQDSQCPGRKPTCTAGKCG